PILTTSLDGDVIAVRPAPASPISGLHPRPTILSKRKSLVPVLTKIETEAVFPADAASLPRLDPILIDFSLITGKKGANQTVQGGLWLSGDRTEALARLQWIVGVEDARLLVVDASGQVQIDVKELAELAGVAKVDALASAEVVANYIYSNEGLLLLVQLTQCMRRYCLHIGHQSPTRGCEVEVTGSINLDNNYDSRINPYRRHGRKLDNERPPDGFD